MANLVSPVPIRHLRFKCGAIAKPCNPLFLKPFPGFRSLLTRIRLSPVRISRTDTFSQRASLQHKTLLVETYHEHRILKSLLRKLQQQDSSPLRILEEDGDWSKDQFWAVVRFLKHASRSKEILQVFDMWKKIEECRINELNYNKIIRVLAEEGMMVEAVAALQEMKTHGLKPSSGAYNSIIHGFSMEGKFSDALFFLSEMKVSNVLPDTETYDSLIQGYGKFKMYDEMGLCVKKMEWDGCSLGQTTYNILIREFSKGGLLQRVESVYQRMLSKKMLLHSSTLVAMLEAYARFGIVTKMEKIYRKLMNSETPLKDDLIRKIAEVYIENYMYSRLEDLGLDLLSTFGGTELVWCLRLLSYACLLSRKGMDIIVGEMQGAKVQWNVTLANITMLAYVKMNDFTHLRIFLSQLSALRVKPDIVTIGIIFDATRMGFDGSRTLERWRRMGYLHRVVEMETDSLVLAAFGKGHFLKTCEEVYSSLRPEDRERKTWTYDRLVDLVSKHIEGSMSRRTTK
ncbi:pentatricopeptide repeat-containing protein At4g14190, chloroplastic [Neltuma alba]|uniref:pentatricopeptide repeat-containing protein At4g14190, chloroplastic n=1 Tax=Neltuma alba TaxID=207710 RepID=UPI0010A3D919|nr:pentatricopeptide repeat-containing protein At4g14190, chloroplastic [Prosopis alba]